MVGVNPKSDYCYIENNNEKWISENDNNSNLEFYLDKICNGGISKKTLFNSLKDF